MDDERSVQIILSLTVLILFVMFVVFVTKTIFRIIGWILKQIWYALTGKKRYKDPTQSDDWLVRAQARQEIRFQNASPPLLSETKSKKGTVQQQRNKTPKHEPKWYPSGWVFNEETQLWDPPDYLCKESKEKWEWDEQRQIWIERQKGNPRKRTNKYKSKDKSTT